MKFTAEQQAYLEKMIDMEGLDIIEVRTRIKGDVFGYVLGDIWGDVKGDVHGEVEGNVWGEEVIT